MKYGFWVFWLNFFDKIVFYIEDRILDLEQNYDNKYKPKVSFYDLFDSED